MFGVPKALIFKPRQSANISFDSEFHWNEENKIKFIFKASTLALFKNRGLGQLGNGLLTKKVKKRG